MVRRLFRSMFFLPIYIFGALGAYKAALRTQGRVVVAPKILLIRPDHLGDVVLATPVLRALREHVPEAHVTMMVGPWSHDVVKNHPDVDDLIVCPFPALQRSTKRTVASYIRLLRTLSQLRSGRYDLAINLHSGYPDYWWGAVLTFLACIPRRIGYAHRPDTLFLTHTLPFQTTQHVTVSNLHLVSMGLHLLGYSSLEEPYTYERYPLYFVPTQEDHQWVTSRFAETGIDTTSIVVVIHPGTGAAVKLWRTEAWAACADICVSQLPNHVIASVILTGSLHEQPMLEEIARRMLSRPLLITDTTIGQLAALFCRAELVLGVDNGPLHLATAVNTPTIRIFGPTNPSMFGPWGSSEQHSIVTSTYRCSNCLSIPCGRLYFSPQELSEHPCVKIIKEHQVQKFIISMQEKYKCIYTNDIQADKNTCYR